MIATSSHPTPYDDDYETCVDTRATLTIYPGATSPYLVAERLKVEATDVAAAGETRPTRLGTLRVVPVSIWRLSSDGHVKSLDLRRHLDWVIERVAPRSEVLRELQEIPGLHMAMRCAWYSREGKGGPTLWPEQMRQLAAMNLECTLDLYSLG